MCLDVFDHGYPEEYCLPYAGLGRDAAAFSPDILNSVYFEYSLINLRAPDATTITPTTTTTTATTTATATATATIITTTQTDRQLQLLSQSTNQPTNQLLS